MSATRERIFRAPGRINLIGEHTDYNDGFVMPAAISLSTRVALTPLSKRRLEIISDNLNEEVVHNLEDSNPQPRNHWSDYVVGIALMLQRAGLSLSGAQLRIRGEIPIGSGLSSSASLTVATAWALISNSNMNLDRSEVATLCRRAENEFVGTQVGIMDPFVSLHGERNRALFLDCRSLDYELLPLPENSKLVVCNTMVNHELGSGEYNQRRAQCEAGVKHLTQSLPNTKALRDLTLAELERHGEGLPEVVFRRCRHVISENDRVLGARKALVEQDLNAFGQLMYASHESLRSDYEVSCRELDLLVDQARMIDGVFGARMTGGGFGGCTVNLVARESVENFKESIAAEYERKTTLKPQIFVCETADGACEVK